MPNRQQHKDLNYSVRPVGGVMRTLCVHLRGSMKINSQVTVQFDPGQFLYVLFFKSGTPVALAMRKEVSRVSGEWIVQYENIRWLCDEKPEETYAALDR